MIDKPGRLFSVTAVATSQPLPSVKLEGRRAALSRTKGWFIRIFTGLVQQWNRGGATAQKDQTFDRDGDHYFETVTVRDTGEVVHHCDEPLSQHRGHGSDRPTKK
jgi:hypothetical protein